MNKNMAKFIDRLDEESYNKYTSIKNFCLAKSNRSILEVGDGVEMFDTIVEQLSKISEFVFDSYKSLLDWLATTEIIMDKVVYKTRQNNIRYLQTLNKDNKNVNKKVSFLEVKDFKIPVMTGLKVDIKTFNKMLATGNYFNVVADELINLRSIANFMIENNGYTIENNGSEILNTSDLMNKINVNNDLIKKLKKELSSVINPNSLKDVLPLSKLIKSLSDLEKETEDTIKLGRMYSVEKIEEIDKVYKETNEKVEEMLNIMEVSEESKIDHSGKAIAVLSRYVHSVAELLSFTSMKYFYYSLIADTLIAIHVGIKEFASTRDSESVDKILSSVMTTIDTSINNIISIFNNN